MKNLSKKGLSLILFMTLFVITILSTGIPVNAATIDELYPVMSSPPFTPGQIQKDHILMAYSASALPSSIDKTSSYPTPGNQGSQGSCTAWAVAYAYKSMQENLEHQWGLSGASTQFSPAFVYNQIYIGSDEGSYIGDAMQLLKDKGCCTLADMPYNAWDYQTQPNATQLSKAYPHRSASYGSVYGEYDLKNSIVTTGGAVIGIPVYHDFDSISSSNPVYDVLDYGNRGWHAICLVGYNDAMGAFKFINSWGGSWGLSGYGWISYSLINNMSVGIYGYTMTDLDEAINASDFQLEGDRISALSGGTLLVKEGSLQSGWVTEASGMSKFQLCGNRIAILQGSVLSVKEGGLSTNWVIVASGVSDFQLEGNRIAILQGNTLSVKEGGLSTNWVTEASGVSKFQLCGNRIAILQGNTLSVKEGGLSTNWVVESNYVSKFQLEGDRIAILQEDKLSVKEGGLSTNWVAEASYVSDFQLCGKRIAVLQGNTLSVKEGGLSTNWVTEANYVLKFQLEGDRIAILQGDTLSVKEGGLSTNWVTEANYVSKFQLCGKRIAVLRGSTLSVKEGGLSTNWINQ
ncbi:MAG: C1 family peptidase [Oscillospiraceae bacterium]|nr:C1 family peptidase [Oscillospiraceae bacterium]